MRNGEVYICGYVGNFDQQQAPARLDAFVPGNEATRIVSISAGQHFFVAVTATGNVMSLGSANYGATGKRSMAYREVYTVPLFGEASSAGASANGSGKRVNARQVACTSESSAILDEEGKVWVAGRAGTFSIISMLF